ncbi:UNVERIFIED_CONTAM: hypothetical protein Scaly_3143100 [Sesamum calycinum]|uniref:DUF4283 domain-containing protein n=1 Tax=Sesamum calycinum TaxID=2727403 RepID=A0AAW2JFG1_9LAMI
MDEGEDGDLVDGNHGAVSEVPAAVTTTGGGSTMGDETEHGELENEGHGAGPAAPTTPMTEEGDSTMEKLKADFNIKEFFELASRPTPFPAPISRPARRDLRRPTAEQAALLCEAPPSGSVEPQRVKSPRGPLAALTFDTSTAVSPTLTAASPRTVAQHITPSPLMATSMVAEDGASPTRPIPPGEAPLVVEVWSPSPPTPTVNVQPAAGLMLGLNGFLHHQLPAGSSSPTALVQPAETRPPPQSWDRMKMPHHHAATATLPKPLISPQPPTTALPATTAPPATTAAPAKLMPEFFIGNVPFNPHMPSKIDEDKIATAFHNSSRKTLNFILPSVQNGEPYFHHLNEFVRSIWPGVRDVKATSNGFFFFQFNSVDAMEEVIEGGPWLYLGQPIVLQKWEPGMVLRKLKHTEVPIWIKLRHLPVELWTTEGLSTVASGIGRPLYPDAITRTCTRLDFARVCIMLHVSSKLPKHVVIMMPNELGGESACKVDVEYEWLPPKCTSCSSLGHSLKECPLSKPMKPAVSLYVRKSMPPNRLHRN